MAAFLGQIMMFGGNFAPRNWALCDGQILPIAQHTALFSLLGTTYGGDGRTTFALPDLRGRVPMHAGSGPGLSNRRLGQRLGSETNTLNALQMPSHSHMAATNVGVKIAVNNDPGEDSTPAEQYIAGGNNIYIDSPEGSEFLGGVSGTASTRVSNAGGNQAVNNIQPSLAVNYIISLQGVFPQRS